jgi:hypothetical protein
MYYSFIWLKECEETTKISGNVVSLLAEIRTLYLRMQSAKHDAAKFGAINEEFWLVL